MERGKRNVGGRSGAEVDGLVGDESPVVRALNRRDASKIFDIASAALRTTNADDQRLALEQIQKIASEMDARTGRRDPSLRKAPVMSKAAAKKAPAKKKTAKRK